MCSNLEKNYCLGMAALLESSNFYLKLTLVEALVVVVVVVVGAKGKHLEPEVAVAPVEYLVEEAPAVLESLVALAEYVVE